MKRSRSIRMGGSRLSRTFGSYRSRNKLSATNAQQVQLAGTHLFGPANYVLYILAYRKQTPAEGVRYSRGEREDQACNHVRRNFPAFVQKFLHERQPLPR